MLDLNSLDCKLLKGQRVSFQLVGLTISCTSRYLQAVWCYCFSFGKGEDQWKEVRKVAVVLKIYGKEISHTVALLEKMHVTVLLSSCPILNWGLLDMFVLCFVSRYIENPIGHYYSFCFPFSNEFLKEFEFSAIFSSNTPSCTTLSFPAWTPLKWTLDLSVSHKSLRVGFLKNFFFALFKIDTLLICLQGYWLFPLSYSLGFWACPGGS